MADISLAFLWHQHQPYYPDDFIGENPMPWVRLHGVKDYYGMLLHLMEFPTMRCTINLVPSLVEQLLQYTEQGRSDRFLDVSRMNADNLGEAEAVFLLDNFFMANPHQMILPFSRYAELYNRRGAGRCSAQEALRRFNSRDLRDLQVWFNLAWVHPIAVSQDPFLSGLATKGRNFTEEEKNLLLDKHLEILRKVLPLHKKLQDDRQVEITTTPYFHPIVPLLLDKKFAREALPQIQLPPYQGGYIEDAKVHFQYAVDQYKSIFGTQPLGMWPSEGSVCQSFISLAESYGFRWIATDEEILSASTHGEVSRDSQGYVRNPQKLYAPYRVHDSGKSINIVFRDHALSDLIGFRYQHSEPQAAAQDFIHTLQEIGKSINSDKPALVTVILDGENCWEHYPGGGVDFIRTLFQKCTSTPGLQSVRIGDYLESNPPSNNLDHLFAGSWINHNFAIWVGHEEDNTAWDLLHKAREYLKTKQDSCPAETLRKAWREIYIAQGSDWFWWYGDDHSCAQDALFDELFRRHLKNAYSFLGEMPPVELDRPIRKKGARNIHTLPRSFLEIRIDGLPRFFEWLTAGHYACQGERGTMAMTTKGPLRDVYFGFNLQKLFIRIDCISDARQTLGQYHKIKIVFLEPKEHQILIDISKIESPSITHLFENAQLKTTLEIAIQKVVELSIPFDDLGVMENATVSFYVEILENELGRDRAPREGLITFKRPGRDFEQIMWDV